MEVKQVKIGAVKPYENNARFNDEAVEYVANSISEFGFQQPIVVDKDMVVIAGHTRLKAAKDLNFDTVPVVVADGLSDEQVKAYRLADNKTGEIAEWDFDKLNIELGELEPFDIDMQDFGFNLSGSEDEDKVENQEKDISDSINEKYQVIIDCKNENDLENTYTKLVEEGYTCKISTL